VEHEYSKCCRQWDRKNPSKHASKNRGANHQGDDDRNGMESNPIPDDTRLEYKSFHDLDESKYREHQAEVSPIAELGERD
jgi:hypothetical protein